MAARPDVSQSVIVTFDGPISVGKTTLCHELHQRLEGASVFLPEDGHLSSCGGEHPVDIFIRNPKKLGGSFQMLMYCKCQARIQCAELHLVIANLRNTPSIVMVDRSLIGNAVFAVTNKGIDNIDEEEYALYKSALGCKPVMSLASSRVNVQLWAPVSVCIGRLKKRHALENTSEDKYQVSYFWDLARAAFCALLSNLSSEEPHHQLVLNWEAATETAVDNFCAIYNAYLADKSGEPPVSVRLSYSPCPVADEHLYTSIFNYSAVPKFYSRAVITEVMSSVALRDRYVGARKFFIQLPENIPHTDIFPLTIQ